MPSILLEIAKNLLAKVSYGIEGRSDDDEEWLITVDHVYVGDHENIDIIKALSIDFIAGIEEEISSLEEE